MSVLKHLRKGGTPRPSLTSKINPKVKGFLNGDYDDAIGGAVKSGVKKIGGGAKTVASLPGKGIKAVSSPIDRGADYVADKVIDGMAAGARKMVKDDPRGKRFMNGYTGKNESGLAVGIALAGGTAYGLGSYKYQVETREKPGEVTYGGEAAVFGADAVGSTTNAPTLGASGSMVFGMHNGRKG